MTVLTIASITTKIIICFYITIRHDDIPPFLVPVFSYVGITLFGIVSWACIQIVEVLRESEALISTLISVAAEGGKETGGSLLHDRELKKYIVRRGKATRSMR